MNDIWNITIPHINHFGAMNAKMKYSLWADVVRIATTTDNLSQLSTKVFITLNPNKQNQSIEMYGLINCKSIIYYKFRIMNDMDTDDWIRSLPGKRFITNNDHAQSVKFANSKLHDITEYICSRKSC